MKYSAIVGLMVSLSVVGCSQDDDDNATPAPAPAPPAATYPISGSMVFKGNMEGTAVLYTNGVGGVAHDTTDLSGAGSASFWSEFVQSSPSNSLALVAFNNFPYTGSSMPNAQFYSLFTVGAKTVAGFSPGANGVSVSFRSGNATYWSPQATQNAQSNFIITDTQQINDGSGIIKVRIRATFNLRVVNQSTGAMKTITDGVFVGTFAKD